jgi:hypothetical protein
VIHTTTGDFHNSPTATFSHWKLRVDETQPSPNKITKKRKRKKNEKKTTRSIDDAEEESYSDNSNSSLNDTPMQTTQTGIFIENIQSSAPVFTSEVLNTQTARAPRTSIAIRELINDKDVEPTEPTEHDSR